MAIDETCWGEGQTMAMAAVRYCIGRKSYIVSDCTNWLIAHWDDFTDDTKKIIERDIEKEVEKDNAARLAGSPYRPLGMDCDRAEWEKVRELWTINMASFDTDPIELTTHDLDQLT